MYCKKCGKDIGTHKKCPFCTTVQHDVDPFTTLGDIEPNISNGNKRSFAYNPHSSSMNYEGYSLPEDHELSDDYFDRVYYSNSNPETAGNNSFSSMNKWDDVSSLQDDVSMDMPAMGGFKPMDDLISPDKDGNQIIEKREKRYNRNFGGKKWIPIVACTSACLIIAGVSAGSQKDTSTASKLGTTINSYVQEESYFEESSTSKQLNQNTKEQLKQNTTSVEREQAAGTLISQTPTSQPQNSNNSTSVAPTVDIAQTYEHATKTYQTMLNDGVFLQADYGKTIRATHYQLLDMNKDGVPEMIVYAVENDVPSFAIYTFRNGKADKIADSVNTCDISLWSNAGHHVYICDGADVFASAEKAVAAYEADTASVIKYDGTRVKTSNGSYVSYSIVEKLIDNSKIVGGTRISSTSKAPAKENAQSQKQNGTAVQLSDGEYYGSLRSWTRDSMVVEMYEFLGWNELYAYREFSQTGKTMTLDISASTILLDRVWLEADHDVKCKSIDAALNTEIWGGGTTVRENFGMDIYFVVKNGTVSEVVILYCP